MLGRTSVSFAVQFINIDGITKYYNITVQDLSYEEIALQFKRRPEHLFIGELVLCCTPPSQSFPSESYIITPSNFDPTDFERKLTMNYNIWILDWIDIHFTNGETNGSFRLLSNPGINFNGFLRGARSRALATNETNFRDHFQTEDLYLTTTRKDHEGSAGIDEIIQGNFDPIFLQNKRIWIVPKWKLRIRFDNLLSLERNEPFKKSYFPDQDFAAIRWDVSKHISRPFRMVLIYGRIGDGRETLLMEDAFCLKKYQNCEFFIDLDESTAFAPTGWRCAHELEQFQFFMSYRQEADMDAVASIYNGLDGCQFGSHNIHLYWDEQCLSEADKLVQGFLSGLKNSTVIVLFFSDKCIEKFKNADTSEDNVLLEWENALQLEAEGRAHIFPILVGNVKNFTGFKMNFPTAKHNHQKSPHILSIRRIVEQIFGIKFTEFEKSTIEFEICRKRIQKKLLNFFSKVEPTLNNPASPSPHLSAEELRRLNTALKPCHETMEQELIRILKRNVDGIRSQRLSEVVDFIDQNSSERILWLTGPHGAGKTSIVAQVCDELEGRNMLGAVYFARCDDSKSKRSLNVIKTMSYQLCNWNAVLGRMVLEYLDGGNVTDSTPEMFHRLILNPLRELHLLHPQIRTMFLIIDAIDAAGDTPNARADLLRIFSWCKNLPSFVKIIVSSTAEDDIRNTLTGQSVRTIHMDSDSEVEMEDSRIYARSFLRKVGFSELKLELGVRLLAEGCGSLADTVSFCENIRDPTSLTISDLQNLIPWTLYGYIRSFFL
ncbi:hypothetical protein HK098_001658 [Nowakowskiella sp. JEL0407]|nr:hypothetical protein HK098_001658 [Nowakowskiella sp. JEL0407]